MEPTLFDKIFPVAASLTGISLGWILNELSAGIKSRRKSKSAYKDILFNLLDVRFILASSNIERFTDMTLTILKTRFPGAIPKDINFYLKQIFNIFLQSIIVEKQMKELKVVQSRYKSAVENISKLEPFLAYTLSGKQFVYNYLDYLNEYTSKVDEISKNQVQDYNKALNSGDLDIFKKKLNEMLQPKLYENAMNVITEDIYTVGIKLDFKSRRKIKEILRKQDTFEIDSDLENLIDGYLKSMLTI